jgi:3D (Asp-Asp-Asp) domain-containing protein
MANYFLAAITATMVLYPAIAGVKADFEPFKSIKNPEISRLKPELIAQARIIIPEEAPSALSMTFFQNIQKTSSIQTTIATQESTPTISKPKTRKVWVTAYSSTPEETDDTPLIAANGTLVHDGIIAANFLPFGTKVQIPSRFGNKIFVVEDRLHERKTNVVDVWMPSKNEAKQFGAYYTEIVILD